MTKVQATANCPSCTWELCEFFESNQEVLDLVHESNKTVDSILLEHMKTHKSVAQFLSYALEDQKPFEEKPHIGFRGSFNLQYKELR